ncbi:MAG: MFS transporter [Christensenellaceae bacterium]|jgi:MFS family permease
MICKFKKAKGYELVIAMASAILLMIGVGVYNGTSGVYVKNVCESLNLSRGGFTFHRTITSVISMISLPFYAMLTQKIGEKKVMMLGSAGLFLATLGFSFAQNLLGVYFSAALGGLFINGVNFVTVGSLLSKWCNNTKGFIIGLAYSGSSLGGALFSPLAAKLSETMGWRTSYRVIGVGTFFLAIITVSLFIRDKAPTLNAKIERKKITLKDYNASIAKAKDNPVFCYLLSSFFCIAVCTSGPYTHLVAYLSDLNYAIGFSSAVMSVYLLSLAGAKILIGIMADKLGIAKSNKLFCICCTITPIIAMFLNMRELVWIYAICLGFSSAGMTVFLPLYTKLCFVDSEFPIMHNFFTLATSLGTAISVPFVGWIYDIFGNYQYAWIVLLLLATIASYGFCKVNMNQYISTKSGEKKQRKLHNN